MNLSDKIFNFYSKIFFLMAAWLLSSGFNDPLSDNPIGSLSEINRQFCTAMQPAAASTVCESSVTACRHITDAISETSLLKAAEQNATGQSTTGQHLPNVPEPNASRQETAYIWEERYLVQYVGGYDDRMGIYDLNTLKDGAFGDYIIRSYGSYRFTEPMKELFLKIAMNDASFQEKPYFIYYDEDDHLRLELYVDVSGAGCGICYGESADGTNETAERSGFVFTESKKAAWEGAQYFMIFDTQAYYIDVPSIQNDESFRNYKESYEYNDAGQVTSFSCEAETNVFSEEWTPVTIASYRCVYREDGSKKEEELFRNSLLFSTSYSSARLHYDESGRIAYIRSYITHGSLEYYFIYEDDGDIPACGIMLDHYPDIVEGIFYQYT